MKRSVIVRLKDMLAMIDAVAEMTDGTDLPRYRSDLMLRLAVERSVEIISEASRHIPDDQKMRFPETPWPEIAAIGNKLRHEYHRVDDAILWGIARRALPDLRLVVTTLIGEGEAN